MATQTEFNAVYKSLADAYPNFSQSERAARGGTYFQGLKRFSVQVLSEMREKAIEESPLYFPSLGKLQIICNRFRRTIRSQPVGERYILFGQCHKDENQIMEDEHEQVYTIKCGCSACHPELWCPKCSKPLSNKVYHGERECIYCGTKVVPEADGFPLSR